MNSGIKSLFVLIWFVFSLEWIVALTRPSLASWPQTVPAAFVTIATALIFTNFYKEYINMLPFCGLGMAAERRRVKGSVKVRLDLCSGAVAGENRLINLTRCPADQISE